MATRSITIGHPRLADDVANGSGLINPYGARYATPSDVYAIDQIVREAFGATAPKSTAARDMKRKNTTYIVATRTVGEKAEDGDGTGNGKGSLSRRVKSIFSSSFGSLEQERSVSHVAGVVGIWTAVDQAHIVVIATRPIRRGRGIGEMLLLATFAEALKIGASNATLEVRKSNWVARSLYRKYGFADVGVRHRYYHDNLEDAIIMSTPSFSDLGYRRSLRSRLLSYCAARGQTRLQEDPMPHLSLPEKE